MGVAKHHVELERDPGGVAGERADVVSEGRKAPGQLCPREAADARDQGAHRSDDDDPEDLSAFCEVAPRDALWARPAAALMPADSYRSKYGGRAICRGAPPEQEHGR